MNSPPEKKSKNKPLPRIDINTELHTHLLKYCRLNYGDIWIDPLGKHKIGCLDASSEEDINKLLQEKKAKLALHDPPYNIIAFEKRNTTDFIDWCQKWVKNTNISLDFDSSFYVWMGSDQTEHFQPLPDFILMMRNTDFSSRSFITMRNQRGYGTQKNWMAVRQELLYYRKGNPTFNIEAEYTDIPKILRGYYKEINGIKTENIERGKSENIRAGNVWVDIQQVFYRMEENVNGCFVQKPLKSCERIIKASSNQNDLVLDFFAHSGSTLISSELLQRNCFTIDIDPVFCEISIRRLERLRKTGKTGWQMGNPFEEEISNDKNLQLLISSLLNKE